VRLVYLDEAGRSRNEGRYLVVAGAIVHGDQQYREVDAYLRDLRDTHFPGDADGVAFHAKDIWHGTGRFPRETWARTKRVELLQRLIEVPEKFGLYLVCGLVRWEAFPTTIVLPDVKDGTREIAAHASAILMCALSVEEWMRLAFPNENAMLYAEDTDRVKRVVKTVHRQCKDPKWAEQFLQQSSAKTTLLPFTHIIDTVHFVEKADSRLLQVADVCAFFIRRYLNGSADAAPFYQRIVRRLWRVPKAAGVSGGQPA
jgi:hypothetical protein